MDCVAASREYDKGDKSIGSVFARDISVNDAREAIVGRQEFREYDAGDASIFTYYLGQSKDDNMFPNPEKAPDEITRRRWLVRRECRGLVFSKGQGNELLSRRLHKFHNIGEVPDETSVDCIDFSQPFVATEKLDGSMICPYITGGSLRMATRMGVTDTALACETHMRASGVPYFEFCQEWLRRGYSCIFEWCDVNVPVVLRYSTSQAVLVAIRHIATGQYLSVAQMQEVAAPSRIPVVKCFDLNLESSNAQDVIQTLKAGQGVEGYVLRFEGLGKWYKIKTSWYFSKNKALDHFFRNAERFVWNMVLQNEYDDIKSLLSTETVEQMQRFISALMAAMEASKTRLWKLFLDHQDLSDAQFATQIIASLGKGSPEGGILYKLRRKQITSETQLFEEIVHVTKNGCGGSKKSFDGVQHYLCGSLVLDHFVTRKRDAVVDE